MNSRKIISLLQIVFFAFFFSTTAYAQKQELPEVTVDGLHLVPNTKLAVVYAKPGADLAPYKRVQLLDAFVAFRKNWERDQRTRTTHSNRVTAKDIEKIKNSLAEEFQTIFKTALEEAGYEVTDESGEDVMVVRPAIINLDVNAPDMRSASRTTTYVSSAGEMTLYVELYDSLTGDLFLKALDGKADRAHASFYTWANSATNRAAARRILKGWAEILVNALNEAKSYHPAAESES